MGQGIPRILVVEDEPSQVEVLLYNLSIEGFDVANVETGEEALLVLEETDFDLIILDWMLPEISGLEVCRRIKSNEHNKRIPIIMLTARGEEEDKVRGLNLGASDFVTKPYSMRELLARVRSNLRDNSNKNIDILSFDALRMDVVAHSVTVSDVKVALGPIEFKLLRILLENPKKVLSREQLLGRVWHNNLNVETRTVDVHIGRLRKQLREVSNVNFIRTVRGFGYSLELEKDDS